MQPSVHRCPTQIACIDDVTHQITWKIAELRNVLSKSNGKRIKIILLLSVNQNGKTTFISLAFGNDKHVIGNGFDETTNSVTIDGPYSIVYLMKRWNIQLSENINDDTDIYVIDVKGFRGCESGQNYHENQESYTKLISPFISIASCIICMAQSNENSSTSQIISACRLDEYGININNSSIKYSVMLMTLIRNVRICNGIDYTNPNQNSYEQISSFLVNNWQKSFLRDTNCTALTKPLPEYSGNNHFTQSSEFYNGFKFVVKDLIQILLNQNKIMSTRNIDTICNNFNRVRNFIESFNFELIRSSQKDFFMQSMFDNSDFELNNLKPSIEAYIHDYQEKQRQIPLTNEIELNSNKVSQNLSNQYIAMFNTFIHGRLNANYFVIPEVKNYLSQKEAQIKNQINKNMPQLMQNIKDYIIESINTIVKRMDPSLNTYINLYLNNDNCLELTHQRKLNENETKTFLYDDYIQKFNQFLHTSINNCYFKSSEFTHLFNLFEKQIKKSIEIKLPEIMKIIYDIIEEKGKHVIKKITSHITNEIDKECKNLMNKTIFEYILTDDDEFYREFHKHFISIADKSTKLSIHDCYNKVESIKKLKETMHKDIDSYIIKVRPDVMQKLRKKRGIQIVARITFGAVVSIAVGACFGVSVTSCAINAIAQTPTGALAISGAGALKVTVGGIYLGVKYGSIIGVAGAPVGAYIYGTSQPDKTYIFVPDFTAINFDQ